MNNYFIDFPKEEYDAYIERLNDNKIIYTTRVSNEVNKYKINCCYKSCFGKLRVVYFKHFLNINDHPFIDELNEGQINEINKYINECGFDVIGLSKE